jgi:hypothetical protein
MKIAIADRLRSFSHKSGHQLIVPGTLIELQVFPTQLAWNSLEGQQSYISFDLKGPMDPFTVEQDVDAKLVRIYGQSKTGYFRMSIQGEPTGLLMLRFEKTPPQGILATSEGVSNHFFSGDAFPLCQIGYVPSSSQERLFLGLGKQKEWERMRDRKDLREILPLWHGLGNTIFEEKKEEDFFPSLEEAISKKEKQKAYDLLLLTYLVHFSAGLFPRGEDTEKQGIAPLLDSTKGLLSQGAQKIRSLFFQEKEEEWYFLPCLPSQFVCGKMTNIQTKSGSNIDIEWTKHRLRKIRIVGIQEREIRLHFPSEIKKFRLKRSYKDRGKTVLVPSAPLIVPEGEIWLDLFQK